MKLLTVIGARPQFIKAAVISRFIRDNPSMGISEFLVHTGQHYDQNMSDIFFTEMDIPRPNVNLSCGSGSHGKMTGEMLGKIEELVIAEKPDAVLVYGDTNSTLAGALAAAKLLVPVAHIEAGLRSFMLAMPEEQNRRLTDNLSTWLFCPTKTAIQNLAAEGISDARLKEPAAAYSPDKKCVRQTGDIMYDASLYYRTVNTKKTDERNFALLTIHRAENTDDPERLKSIVNAINALKDIRFVFPIHPRTRKIVRQLGLTFLPHVKLIDPVGYFEMLSLEEQCDFILTDSGGVQKEAYFFYKPCITMRDSTEWVELVESGWNTLTGADTEKIIRAVQHIHTPAAKPALYGDGQCARKILETLL